MYKVIFIKKESVLIRQQPDFPSVGHRVTINAMTYKVRDVEWRYSDKALEIVIWLL